MQCLAQAPQLLLVLQLAVQARGDGVQAVQQPEQTAGDGPGGPALTWKRQDPQSCPVVPAPSLSWNVRVRRGLRGDVQERELRPRKGKGSFKVTQGTYSFLST